MRTFIRICTATARYQVLRRAMRGDRTEASLCVIRPVSTLTIPSYVCVYARTYTYPRMWAKMHAWIRSDKSISVTRYPDEGELFPKRALARLSRGLCFEMELRETRDLHENGAETRVTRHIHARISTHSNPESLPGLADFI